MKQSCYLVVGLGKTGSSIARYLKRKGCSFVIFDTRTNPPGLEDFKKEFPQTPVYLEHPPQELMSQFTEVIASPGVSLESDFFQALKQENVPFCGDIECLAREIKAPVIAITGTNGKSTVTTMLGEMALAAGLKVAVAGNIGTPVLDKLNEGSYDLWVLELSSFQLELTHSLAPLVATILNVTPDHLDRHHTLEAYVAAKQRIYHQAKVAVFNRDDVLTKPQHAPPCELSFGLDAANADDTQWGLVRHGDEVYLAHETQLIVNVRSLKLYGMHDWLNALCACALAWAINIPKDAIVSALTHFSGLPHRCCLVGTWNDILWINDSKGTNVGASCAAIQGVGDSIQGKIILIAGGEGKGADFGALQEPVTRYVRSVVLMGTDASKIEAALNNAVPVTFAQSMEQAVMLAKQQAHPEDAVLLSPACASFDMFQDFNHRGEVFSTLVHGLNS